VDKFRPSKVKSIIKGYLDKKLENFKVFDSDQAQSFCKQISSEIRDRIKKLKLDQYK